MCVPSVPSVREFTMGEIEHFVDPLDKSHPKLASVAHEVCVCPPSPVARVVAQSIPCLPLSLPLWHWVFVLRVHRVVVTCVRC